MGIGVYAHESFKCKQCEHVFRSAFKYEKTDYCKLCVAIHGKEIHARIRFHRNEIERKKSEENTEITNRKEGEKQAKKKSKSDGD